MVLAVQIGSRLRRLRTAGGWARTPIAIGVVSRVYSLLVIVWADRLRPEPMGNPLAAWDGLWYVSIAENGYHAQPTIVGLRDTAFFPLWPMLMRFSHPLGWDVRVVAPVVASSLFVLACVLVWRLFADRFGEEIASTGTALLAFSPAAYVATMAYSEPLFLVLAAGAFLLGRRAVPRALVTALAFATRISAAGLVLATLVEAVRSRGRDRAGLIVVAATGCVAFALWWVWVGWFMGDPLGFLKGSPEWSHVSGAWAVVAAIRRPDIFNATWFAVYAVAIAGAVVVVRRDLELGSMALGVLALAFLPGGLTSSFPRYAISAFPLFAGLALAVRDRRLPVLGLPLGSLLLVASASCQVLLAYWAFDAKRAP